MTVLPRRQRKISYIYTWQEQHTHTLAGGKDTHKKKRDVWVEVQRSSARKSTSYKKYAHANPHIKSGLGEGGGRAVDKAVTCSLARHRVVSSEASLKMSKGRVSQVFEAADATNTRTKKATRPNVLVLQATHTQCVQTESQFSCHSSLSCRRGH